MTTTTVEFSANISKALYQALKAIVERDLEFQFWYAQAAAVDDALEAKRTHIRDREGRLITHFDEWLLAASEGRWP